MTIKIGQPLWNEILHADESEGYTMCNACETISKGHPELYDEDAPEIRCDDCNAGVLEPTGDLIICGEIEERN